MKLKYWLLILILAAAGTAAGLCWYRQNHGFTAWMNYEEMDNLLKPLEVKDAAGKNFWDRRHWLNAVEGRWHDGRPQFRLRIGDAPEKGGYWWYWWYNQDQASFNKHIHDLSDEHFTMVYSNSFEWPDGTRRFSGVWHRIGKMGTK